MDGNLLWRIKIIDLITMLVDCVLNNLNKV